MTKESSKIYEIYKITNKLNGKYYIGKTSWTAQERWKRHQYDCRKPSSSCHFHAAMRLYGFENFEVETLCECPDEETLNESEKFFIWFLGASKPSIGYNCTEGGDGGKKSAHIRKKMGAANIGRKLTPEHRAILSKANKGKIPKNIVALGKARKGKKHSEESRQKIREARKRQKICHSEETKRKISEANKGKVMSEQSRRKMSESKKRLHAAKRINNEIDSSTLQSAI